MSFVRNFNLLLVKKSEMMLTNKKELRTLKTVIAKQKESTGFYKIKKYYSATVSSEQKCCDDFSNFLVMEDQIGLL